MWESIYPTSLPQLRLRFRTQSRSDYTICGAQCKMKVQVQSNCTGCLSTEMPLSWGMATPGMYRLLDTKESGSGHQPKLVSKKTC